MAIRTMENYVAILPMFADLSFGDYSMAINDTEKCVFYKPGKVLKFPVEVGKTKVLEKSAAWLCMKENRKIFTRVEKKVFGYPYIALAAPLYDDTGKIIGCISVQEMVDKQDRLREMAALINKQVSELASSTELISARAEETAAVANISYKRSQESAARVKTTDDVIRLIKGIAGQTNLLGLNAAIEAARVGELGKGFGVVAAEIRKLAMTTSESIKKIEEILKNVQNDTIDTTDQLGRMETINSEVAEAITKITESVSSIHQQVTNLETVAESLSCDEEEVCKLR